MRCRRATSLLFVAAFSQGATEAISQTEAQLLVCDAEGSEIMRVDLYVPSDFGPLHCLEGFPIADMTPCAPDGGWGLSAGTGLAELTEVTLGWNRAFEHSSGKFFAILSASSFEAHGLHGTGIGMAPAVPEFELWIDRISGEGRYGLSDGTVVDLVCQERDRAF